MEGDISARHFYALISRTLNRAGGSDNFERLELYLPKHPARKQAGPPAAPTFPAIADAIAECGLIETIKGNRVVPVDREDLIWQKTCETRKAMLQAGQPKNRLDRQLCNFLFERFFRPALTRRAVKKRFDRRVAAWVAGKSFDCREENKGAATGELTQQILALSWFVPAIEFFYLLTNRTEKSGSIPEAIRRVISLPNLPGGWKEPYKKRLLKKIGLKIVPTCPDELREEITARLNSGRLPIPEKLRSQIINKVRSLVSAYRRPHETELNTLQCPGTMMISRRNGRQEFVRAGDVLEADDGSINFPVCIPWTSPNGGLITETPCSAKFGVIVGRFQWLRSIDVATRFRPGWAFVARSRGSYRGADVLTLLNGLTRQHGAWEEYRFERGVFECDLVKRAVELLGSHLHTVRSPHAKPFIEGGFNQDWTKLSVHFPQCDIGRFRGDTEAASKLVQSCRAGHNDPQKFFPMMADAMRAFEEITQEENQALVKSRNSGQWIPQERWQRETGENPLRCLDESRMFAFAPYAKEWTVKGMLGGGRVPIFENVSVPFDFSAPWLHEFSGAKLRVHFDAMAHKCEATPVLLQAWNGHSTGEVLRPIQQVNETTGYIRTILGWGDDIATRGLKARQQAGAAMRREVRTVMPGGRAGYSSSELKTIETAVTIEKPSAESQKSERREDSAVVSGNRLTQSLSASLVVDRAAELRDKMDRIEKFERENPNLFV